MRGAAPGAEIVTPAVMPVVPAMVPRVRARPPVILQAIATKDKIPLPWAGLNLLIFVSFAEYFDEGAGDSKTERVVCEFCKTPQTLYYKATGNSVCMELEKVCPEEKSKSEQSENSSSS